MRRKAQFTIGALILAALGFLLGPEALEGWSAPAAASGSSATEAAQASVGFTSQRALDEHYAKHGSEFGPISKQRYLTLAQELRDAPAGGALREAVRPDGVVTRFDARTGAFVAFHQDRTIRTFFKPDDGPRYFERQIERERR
ncbi:MAG: hypothetical protein JNK02_09290 [Planctomycetes bacterium]|nr:hypothetical protein [Planctomycetota bacterium]